MKTGFLASFLAVLLSGPAFAQSLKSELPAPLQPGVNKGTVDTFIGTHYWFFNGGPGKTHVHAQFVPLGVLGAVPRTTLTVTLFDEGRTWHSEKQLTSEGPMAEFTFDGDLKQPTKILVSVAPPPNGLVRVGGNYELVATGAVAFGSKSTQDPVIGMYKQMGGYTTQLGDCKFEADGAIKTTSGTSGSWKLFDKDLNSYVINVEGQERHTLQYAPGRGLCDGDMILFQQIR